MKEPGQIQVLLHSRTSCGLHACGEERCWLLGKLAVCMGHTVCVVMEEDAANILERGSCTWLFVLPAVRHRGPADTSVGNGTVNVHSTPREQGATQPAGINPVLHSC